MEHLNKSQLVLLALLISFVSSIATGIVTVTLMQQAPKSVTQGINQVVQKTIERVVPIKGPSVTETRIVKEEDLVVSAIENNINSLVKIRTGVDLSSGIDGDEVGIGIVLSDDGIIGVDASTASLPDTADYYAETASGKIFPINRLADKKNFSLFKAAVKDTSYLKFSPVVLADSDAVKAGQSVISLGNQAGMGIVTGIIYDAPAETATTTQSVKSPAFLRTSTNLRDDLGSAVFNLEGKAIGLVVVRGNGRLTLPSNIIHAAVVEAQKKKQ